VADPEYARLNTGVSITRGNSGNGALPTRGSEEDGNDYHVRQVTDARASRPLSANDRLHTAWYVGGLQSHSRNDHESRVTSLPARQLYRFLATQRLRRDTVRERVGMKISVVTHTGPGTVLLGSLRHTVFLTGSKVVP
jgi:hypothetical protein